MSYFTVLFLVAFWTILAHAKTQETGRCGQRPVDVIFLLDGSRSVRPANFEIVKNYVKNFTYIFKEIGPSAAQIGVIQFASRIREEIQLNQYLNRTTLFQAIDDIKYMEMGTMTGQAVKYMVEIALAPSHGSRIRTHNVRTVALVITDGKSQDYHRGTLTKWQRKAKKRGVEFFAIGVGTRSNERELREIASIPKQEHVFHTKDFDGIQSIALQLRDLESCDPETPSPNHLRTDNVTLSAATVRWRSPSPSRHHSLFYYVLTCYKVGIDGQTRVFKIVLPGNATSCKLTNLQSSSLYNVTIETNYSNSSVQLDPVHTQFTTDSLLSPTVNVLNTSLCEVTVDWSNKDRRVSYWKVNLFDGDTENLIESRTLPANQSKVTFDDLPPSTRFNCTVTGVIIEENQNYTVVGGIVITTDTLSAPVLHVNHIKATAVRLLWSDINYQTRSWTIKYHPKGKPRQFKIANISGEELTTVITQLTPSTIYKFEVYGNVVVNGNRFTSPKDRTRATTKSLPSPTNVRITSTSITNLAVEWDDAETPPADSWLVLTRKQGEKGWKQVGNISSQQHHFSINDLLPNTTYEVAVCGRYLDGGRVYIGPKVIATGKTNHIVAPSLNCHVVSMDSITVTWSDVSDEVTSWSVSIYPENNSDNKAWFYEDVDSRSRAFKNLSPATNYVIQLQANIARTDQSYHRSDDSTLLCTTKPEPPANLHVVERRPTSLVFDFDPPEGRVHSYIAQCSASDNPNIEIEAIITDDLKIVCSNLKPSTLYVTKVATQYKNLTSSFISTSATTIPRISNSLQLLNVTTHSVNVTWKIPEDIDVDFYYVSFNFSEDDMDLVIVNGTVSWVVLDHLEPNTEYFVRVFTEVDEEKIFTEESITRTEAEILDLRIDSVGFTSINVSWSSSSVPTLESYCLKYTPAYLPNYENDLLIPTDVFSYSLTDLETATRYKIALNARYPLSQSEEVERFATTLALPPIGPINFTEIARTSFVASWFPPETNPDPVSYIVTYTSADQDPVTIEGHKTTSLLIDDVLEATLYHVTVQACYPDELVSHPIEGEVTTLTPDPSTCSCSTYLNSQSKMMEIMEEMVEKISVLNKRFVKFRRASKKKKQRKSKHRVRNKKNP